MDRRASGRGERPFRTAALVAFLCGHTLVWPALVLHLGGARNAADGLPTLLGPFFLRAGDWFTGGIALAGLCFTASIVLKTCDAVRTRGDRQKTRSAVWTGRVLLSIGTFAVLVTALFHVALNAFFPTEFQRLTPESENGCQVVLEIHTGMASQSGRLLLQPPSKSALIDTGITWYYDDGRLYDPGWALSWRGDDATVQAPEGVSFRGGHTPVDAERTASLNCE